MPRPAQGYIGPRAQITQLPNVQFSTAVGEGFLTFSRMMQGVSADLRQKEDARLSIAGQKAGASAAGTSSVYDPTTGSYLPSLPKADETTAYGKAYANAAQTVYLQRLQTLQRDKAREVAAANRDDPQRMTELYNKWADGVKKGMPAYLRPTFDHDSSVLMSPHILAAHDRIAKAQQRDQKATLEALHDSSLVDTQQYGRMAAEGGAGGEKAMQAAASTYFGTIGKMRARVDGINYTGGEFQRDTIQYTSDFVEQFVGGLFLGAENKAQMLHEYLNGNLQVPTPVAAEVRGPTGTVTEVRPEVRMMKLTDVTTRDAQNRLKTLMTGIVSAQRSQFEQNRADEERAQRQSLNLDLRVLATEGNSAIGNAAFDALSKNPLASDETIARGRNWLMGGVTESDYYASARMRILSGQVTDPMQLDPTRLSVESRRDLVKMITDRNETNHWSKSRIYKQSSDRIKTELGASISDMVTEIYIGQKGDKAGIMRQAVNRFTNHLNDQMQRNVDDPNTIVGHNASGNIREEVEITDPQSGERKKVERWDPLVWVKTQLEEYRSRLVPMSGKLEELKKQRHDLYTTSAKGMTKEQLSANNIRVTQLQDAIVAERQKLHDALINIVAGDE